MKLKVYSLFDSAAGAYTQPFFMHNDGLAIRAFSDNVNADNNNVSYHPDQFTLFQVGEWDDISGEIVEISPKKNLGHGLQFKQPSSEQKSYDAMMEKIERLEKFVKEVVK